MSQIKITHYGLTDIGNVRQANEDSLGSVEGPYGPIFTVCDGMGGHVGGAAASSLAVKTILEFISGATIENPSVAINNALISANQKILETANENPGLRGMGTTATILVVQPQGLYIGHVGDSRVYIFSDNQLHRLTIDHSFVQTLIDSGAISYAEAEQHPRKNELMKALGVADSVQPTIISNPIKPKKNDILLLCTDGLCGLVSDTEMQHILSDNPELSQAAEQLIEEAKNAGGFDNITVQLVRITDSPYNRSEFISHSPLKNETQEIPVDIKDKNKQPVSLNYQELNPVPKKKSFVRFTIAGVLIASLVCFFYVTKRWPFNGTLIMTTDSTAILDKNGFLPGDMVRGDYLIHTIDEKKDTDLASLVRIRKDQSTLPYTSYKYDTTWSMGNSPAESKNFKGLQKVKWKKREPTTSSIPDNPITVTADSLRAAEERQRRPVQPRDPVQKDTVPDNRPGADESKELEVLKDLQNQFGAAQENLVKAKNKLSVAEKKYQAMSDSVAENSSNSAKLKIFQPKLEKATKDLGNAKIEKEKYEKQKDLLQTKLNDLKGKTQEN